ncbi:MAG: ATP-binding cassette domain-containing protein [Thermoflavifilum sp.]|nr:ATP-binding cassette domain-containing protein [Thermoflavifilum sp.]
MSNVLFRFKQVTIYRGQQCIVRDLDWQVHRGELVLITGPNGSGKTTILKAIAGKLPIQQGKIVYHSDTDHSHSTWGLSAHQVGWVDFHAGDLLWRHPDTFYQQRYHASQTHGWQRVIDMLQEYATMQLGMTDEALNIRLTELVEVQQLFPSYLLQRSLQQLSNGELKKCMILRALLVKPSLLLLNAPFVGLDAPSRSQLRWLLHRIQQIDTTVIIEALEIEHDEKYDQCLQLSPPYPPKPVQLPYIPVLTVQPTTPIIDMQHVEVKYAHKPVLQDINWRVNAGERWLIGGQNGAGKSTLLSLLTTDHPQAYANVIYWMGKRRGTGESIWDIRKQIAYISPEMHSYFRTTQTCLSLILHAASNSSSHMASHLRDTAMAYLRYFGLEDFADQPFSQLSSGQQRLVLLISILLQRAPIWILDEPCQGLDVHHRKLFMQLIDHLPQSPAFTLLYVTHRFEEIPTHMTHFLYLENGRITYSGVYSREWARKKLSAQIVS